MARKQYDVAAALDRLQNFADKYIAAETNRRIQLGREKEARMVGAYGYMLQEEESKISELETALQLIETNLLDRGIELQSVKSENRTVAAEELLTAANEGAMEMVQVRLDGSRDYKERLESRHREAMKVKRHIDLFDDAITLLLDPKHFGKKNIVDALDVAKAAQDFVRANSKYAPEVEQRLKELQTESQLERLQEDYYARLAKESEEKRVAAVASQTDAAIKIETLEPIKKEAQEAVKAMTYQPISKMVERYGFIISRQSDIEAGVDSRTGKDLTSRNIEDMKLEITEEEVRIGQYLYPWAPQTQASFNAQRFQTALTKAIKNGDYYDIINYLKEGNAQYKIMLQQGSPLAELYRTDVQSMFGLDISSDDFVSQLVELNEISGRIDIEQATEAIKIGRTLLPEVPEGDETAEDLLLKEFFEGGKK